MIVKPKILAFFFTLVSITILLLPSHNRQAAHGLLRNAGFDFESVNYTAWRGNMEDTIGGFGKSFQDWANSVGKGWEDVAPGEDSIVGGMGEGRIWNDDDGDDDGDEGEGEVELDFDLSGSNDSPAKEDIDTSKPYFHPNGMYVLPPSFLSKEENTEPNVKNQHPISLLIQRAQEQWSNLLKESPKLPPHDKPIDPSAYKPFYDHYRKVNHRHPPVGYDRFLAFCQQHSVKLPHLLSKQIVHDLAPFWGLEPNDLRHRSNVMANERADTFTINIQTGEGTALIYGEAKDLKRATDLSSLISWFAKDLKGLGLGWHGVQDDPSSYKRVGDGFINITLTRQDLPAVALGYEQRERLIELGRQGEYFGPSDFIAPADDSFSRWANSCPPNSPMRLAESSPETPLEELSDPPVQNTTKSFAYDYRNTMDVCLHPEWKGMHGFTMAVGTALGPLVPLFTFAKTTAQSDILVTPLEQYSDTYIGYDPDWKLKTKNKLLWRGSTTGVEFNVHFDWKNSQRARLHFMTNEAEGKREIISPNAVEGLEVQNLDVAEFNREFMDTKFSGKPVQCDEKTCEEMEKLIEFAPTMGLDESYQYKYLMDIDGNGWSGRFHRLMSTKAVVLKSSIFPEWYGSRIMPWVHYVPVKVDYSDLYDIMAYFVGTPDASNVGHDEEAAKIALAGKDWAKDYWRREDMAAYMFLLTLEYGRVISRDENNPFDYVEDLDFIRVRRSI